MGMPITVYFVFPDGCEEKYQNVNMPVIPKIGDFIQGATPRSGRYRVSGVVFSIDHEQQRCTEVNVELEALDKTNS